MKSLFHFLLFLLILIIPAHLHSQVKQVLYINQTGVDPGNNGSPPENDAVIRMLNADGNFQVTYIETSKDGSAIPDLSGFDLAIAQESIISGAEMFKPGGKLSIKDVSIPIIYCKSSAFRDGRAVTDVDAKAEGTQNLFLTVPANNQSHALFSGIDFSNGDEIPITFALTNNSGSDPGAKAIDIINNLEISTPGTLLGTVPEVTNPDKAIVVNYLQSGTQLGEATTDVLSVDAITLSFGYGPLVYQDGSNISNEALTIWRNAAYLLTGLEVPSTLYYNPSLTKKILYVNQVGVDPGTGGGAQPGYDPVARMLALEDFFDVTYVETSADGNQLPDLSQFDLIVAQETMNGDAALFKSDGKLGIKNVPVPIIYNTIAAFTNNNAITDGNAEYIQTSNLVVNVSRAAQRHQLFNGIDFSGGGEIQLISSTASDNGSDEGSRALDMVNQLNLGSGNLLLATVPEVSNPDEALVVNYLPAGTQIGENSADALQVNAIVLPFSYGSIAKQNGANLTNKGLTLWRNAAYMLTGLPVPNTLCSSPALTKLVLYINQKGVDPANSGASEPGNDPITRMFNSDPNFKLTYIETYTGGQQIPDPQLYDLIIAQETLSSGASLFKPGEVLGINSVTAPIIYNKASIFRNERAVSESDVELLTTSNLFLNVPAENQDHELFSGINFINGNEIRIFAAGATSDGAPGGSRAMEIVNNLKISANNTLLASVPEVTQAEQAVVVNYFPAGTQLGESASDKLNVNAFAFSFSYGATVSGDGDNISSEGLTIWRNAAYILTGLEVPSNLYVNEDYALSANDLTSDSPIISCSPNPAKDRVQINLEGNHPDATLALFTIRGKKVWENIVNVGNASLTMDVSKLESGMYLLQFKSNTSHKTIKIVKR